MVIIMMIKILASGSSGNSTYLKIADKNILIDAGISRKRIVDALAKINVLLDDIDYIFITHEHVDHIGGLLNVLKKSKAAIFLTEGTYDKLMMLKDYNLVDSKRFKLIPKLNEGYKPFKLADLEVLALPCYHDASEPVGYLFSSNNKKITYLTDTGYVDGDVLEVIKDSDAYIFECNHDPEILMASNRPYPLKMRILGDHGHLSNADSLYALANLIGSHTKYVFLAHISRECNLKEIIEITKKKIFNKLGVDFKNTEFIYTYPFDIDEVEF